MKQKLLFILPHCSTGGLPAYTLKQIESFINDYEIRVCEVNFYGPDYVVQRNKIKQLVKFKELGSNQKLLPRFISEVAPDIIHFQEIPESFLEEDIVKKIYSPNRNYTLTVTSHSSLSGRHSFIHIPDNIVAVNKWQQQKFQKEIPETEVDIWEYPIEDKKPTFDQRKDAQLKLKLSIAYKKNILNVGLWTPGKNQGELLEIARQNPKNLYHFVGNQAPNFRDYWEPLMKNKPDNCIVWGERDDVELFYQACDEFYFTSKFELNPLVIKEALSYGMPVKMRRLPSYGSDYDNNPLVSYI